LTTSHGDRGRRGAVSSTATAPSGRQIQIAFGDQRAVVVEVGGGLRSYIVGRREILDGYAADEMCSSGRGQVLLPWPNRLEDGAYDFDGKHYQLPIDEIETSNAIHGLVRWRAWEVTEESANRVVMRHTLHGEPGYPFSLALSIEYTLQGTGLSVRTTATNISSSRCPFGVGAHPYLRGGHASVDLFTLQAPAGSFLNSDARGLPASKYSVVVTEYDFRQPRLLGATVLDHAFCDLEREDDGRAHIVISDQENRNAVRLWMDESYPYVMLFSGDTLPDSPRRSLAVEPMTCAPNAFRSGEGLIVLEPGQTFSGQWGISPT
jgi:aldose 1-epimerase